MPNLDLNAPNPIVTSSLLSHCSTCILVQYSHPCFNNLGHHSFCFQFNTSIDNAADHGNAEQMKNLEVRARSGRSVCLVGANSGRVDPIRFHASTCLRLNLANEEHLGNEIMGYTREVYIYVPFSL
jgi:hypothetical protein